jgi:heme oxygenase
MTQDEIIRFAIQCHLVTTGNRDGLYMDALTEFAKLVENKAFKDGYEKGIAAFAEAVELEREATIKIIKETSFSNWFQADVIEAIRARGEA